MMADLKRVTLITGASRGIGRACAERLASAGHHIVNLDLNAPGGDFPGEHVSVNLSDRAQVADCLRALTETYQFNGLLNNVGTTGEQPLAELTLDVFDQVMEVNVITSIQCAKACIPSMREQGFGRIINVSSELILGIAKRTAYAGTKAMLSSFARIWSLELTPLGITVNAIAPGPTNTEFFMNNNPIGSPQREAKLKRIAAGRFAEPEDMANMVDFLMKEESQYVTGQTLFVCGGSSIGNAFLP